MVLLSAIMPALALCLIVLYAALIWRVLRLKSKLRTLGLKNGLEQLTVKRKRLAICAAAFFLLCIAGRVVPQLWSPDMLMVFNYEEAARGLNPNITRFNESNILSDRILEKVILRGGLDMDTEQLSNYLAISTPLDAEKLDVTAESDLKISTEYRVHCSGMVSLHHTDPKTVLDLLANVYWEDFIQNYAENDSLLDLSFEGMEEMEYLDAKDYLQMQANKLRNFIPNYSSESSSFRAAGSGATFASLSQKISNYIEIELERFEAFALENSLSKNRVTYQSRMQYANHLLDTSRKKEMAAHDVRIEAINMYNAFMTRFVLIPTYDTDNEFYMSKTKVGVDYFADEAKEHLEFATKLVEEMEHNSYASAQVGKAEPSYDICLQADQRIEALKAELLELSAQCRELCSAYIKEKRDGYIQVCFTPPSLMAEALNALLLTALFVIAWSGNAVLEPFYQEHRYFGKRRANAESRKKDKEETVL